VLADIRGFPRYLDIIYPATWLTNKQPGHDRSEKPDMGYHIELERREWMSEPTPKTWYPHDGGKKALFLA
jgi:hypothetical protein